MSWQELPVELRTDILSQLIHSDLFRPPPPYESCLSLRLVCRDFNSLFCSILYLGSNRLKDVPAKAKNGATVAWLLSLKAKMDPPGHDKTSTYFQEWASFMAAQSTLQPGGSGNYNQWLDAACRAAAYNGDPQAVCAWLVCSADSVVESVDLAPPRSLAAEQASAKPGNLSYLKNAHGALQIACENGNLEWSSLCCPRELVQVFTIQSLATQSTTPSAMTIWRSFEACFITELIVIPGPVRMQLSWSLPHAMAVPQP
uniref:F-box domain-containing protein n=1 Tax=Bionectria ochroleuca TaxID=29856 RepID=A0A8H7N418_BIOOC